MKHLWKFAPVALLAAGSVAAQTAGAEWTTYGGHVANTRYSGLKQITTANVGRLVPRFMFQTGVSKLGSFENTPVVSEGVMYVTTPYNTAMAYDLKTKKELWRYEHKLGTTIYCCGPNNRGVALHGPHLVAGVAVAYPVTDLATLDEHTHRFEAHYTATLAGSSPEVHHRRSPLTHAARLRRPAQVLNTRLLPALIPRTEGWHAAIVWRTLSRNTLRMP